MSSVITIPLIAKPQTLSISLSGTIYNLTVRWCRIAQAWILDIADQGNAPIVNGIPLITGADLLAQYAYLGIKGRLVVQTSNDPDVPPTFTNLGGDGNLYYLSP